MNRISLIILIIVCGLFGSVIGYSIGLTSNRPIPILILLTLFVGLFGCFVAIVLILKKYDALIWSIGTTFIALIVDWIAGSPRVDMVDKFIFAFFGLYVGFDSWSSRKQVLIAGFVGGILGFIWGISDDRWFGYAYLKPGLLNAILSSIHVFIFGMFFWSSYKGWLGSRRVTIDSAS